MRPVHQLLKHDPDNGVWGDCFRAAIASVLELPVDAVPHVMDGGVSLDEAKARLDEFLASLGLCAVDMPLVPGEGFGLDEVLGLLGEMNGDFVYILTGMTDRGVGHAVVCQGGQVVHNPSPKAHAIVGPLLNGAYVVTLICDRRTTRPATGGAAAGARRGLMH